MEVINLVSPSDTSQKYVKQDNKVLVVASVQNKNVEKPIIDLKGDVFEEHQEKYQKEDQDDEEIKQKLGKVTA